MTRYLLLILFTATMGSRALGLDLSLAPGISIKNAMLYGVFSMIAIEAAISRNRKVELLPVLAPFALLILYAFLTWLFTVLLLEDPFYDPRETLIRLKVKLVDQFLILLVFFYGVVHIEDALWLMRKLIWVIILGCFITVIDTYNVPDIGIIAASDDDGRIEGIIGSAAESSSLWAFFVPAIIALWWTEKGLKKTLALVGIGFAIFSVLLSGTRGPMVGLVVGALLSAIFLRRYVSAQMIVRSAIGMFALTVATLLVVLATDFGVVLEERLTTGLATGDLETISSGRTRFWLEALLRMVEQPLTFIVGFGWEAYYQTMGHRVATHSVYLDRLYNLGLIGLTLILVTAVNVLVTARRGLQTIPKPIAPFLIAFVFGMSSLLISMAFADLEGSAPYAWAFTGLVMRVAVATPNIQVDDRRRTRAHK